MLKITADLFTIYQKALYNNIDEKIYCHFVINVI